MKRIASILLALLCVLLASTAANAQGPSEPMRDDEPGTQAAQPEPKREGRAKFFDPSDGQLDLSYFLDHAHGFIPIPFVVTEPAVGYGGGGAGMFVRPRREAGEEGWARPNLSAAGGLATQNGTWAAFAGDASRWLDGRLRTLVGGGTGQANLDFYGLGLDRPSFDQKVRYSLKFSAAVAQVNWQLAPKSPWALGLRYVYAGVDPKLRDEPAFPGLANRIRVKVSAPTAVVEFDTRDRVFTPSRGIYAETSYLVSREDLGSTDNFERFQQVLIGWHSPSRDVTIGARGDYQWASKETPFFLRPFIQLRVVPAMRYQGDQMASAELEARWQFSGRWSVVVFGGAGAAYSSRDTFSVTQKVGSGGIGFRYELARKFGLHAGIDVAHSRGTNAVYFQVGNAWFRP